MSEDVQREQNAKRMKLDDTHDADDETRASPSTDNDKDNVTDGADLSAIVEAMTTGTDDAAVQCASCERMCALALYPQESDAATIASAVEGVVRALRTHSANAGVVERALHALIKLDEITEAFGNDYTSRRRVCGAIKKSSGVAAVVQTLCDHADHAGIRRAASQALALESLRDSHTFCRAAGISVLLRAVSNYPHDDALRKNAITAIKSSSYALPMSMVTSTVDAVRTRCFSESLSSLRRPPMPTTASTAQNDLFSRLDPHVLGHVLSFVPNHEFYMLYPRLSHSHAYAFTDPVLHRHHCRARFRWNEFQWKLFASSSWPQLSLAVHKHELVRFECDHASEDDESTRDAARDRDVAGALASASSTRLSLSDSSEPRDPRDKDWSLECTHLYRFLRHATLLVLQQAPNVSSTGATIRYTLPRAIEAAIVDMLTSRFVLDILQGRSIYAGYHYITFLQSPSSRFRSQGDEVVLDVRRGVPSNSPWPSTCMETANVSAAPRLHDNDSVYDVFSDFDHDRDPWNAALELDEAAMLGDVAAQGCGGSHFLHALWFGPALRRAIDAHAAAQGGGGGGGGGDSAASTDADRCVIEVDLDDSPIVEVDMKNGDPLPRLIAENATAWAERGGISANDGMTRARARRLAVWFGLITEETAAAANAAYAAADAAAPPKRSTYYDSRDQRVRSARNWQPQGDESSSSSSVESDDAEDVEENMEGRNGAIPQSTKASFTAYLQRAAHKLQDPQFDLHVARRHVLSVAPSMVSDDEEDDEDEEGEEDEEDA